VVGIVLLSVPKMVFLKTYLGWKGRGGWLDHLYALIYSYSKLNHSSPMEYKPDWFKHDRLKPLQALNYSYSKPNHSSPMEYKPGRFKTL